MSHDGLRLWPFVTLRERRCASFRLKRWPSTSTAWRPKVSLCRGWHSLPSDLGWWPQPAHRRALSWICAAVATDHDLRSYGIEPRNGWSSDCALWVQIKSRQFQSLNQCYKELMPPDIESSYSVAVDSRGVVGAPLPYWPRAYTSRLFGYKRRKICNTSHLYFMNLSGTAWPDSWNSVIVLGGRFRGAVESAPHLSVL